MKNYYGSNIRDVGNHNRSLVLKLICTSEPMSRSRLAEKTGLAKMTLSNIVAGLIADGIVMEKRMPAAGTNQTAGRRPILLDLSENSPLICGMLIKRGLCQVILADLRARVKDRAEIRYNRLNSADELINMLAGCYRTLSGRCGRKIMAVSVSSLGPVNTGKGVILNPPDFYGLCNVPVVEEIGKATGKPVFLINDANAGALAEKIYGYGQGIPNFVYLHMMNGIGAGIVLGGRLYEGDTGQSGEFGHTSISMTGPICPCGNTGCLDLFANLGKMKEMAEELKDVYPDSAVFARSGLSWEDYVGLANRRDALAMAVVDRFCGYVSHALTSMLNLLDTNYVIVGYGCESPGTFIERSIGAKVNKAVLFSGYSRVEVRRSFFGGEAPLVGSVACVADKIFDFGPPSDPAENELLGSLFGQNG